jgi:NADH-quinone oxidoreductase subunit J
MNWSLVAFAAFSTIAIVGSILVVLQKNPVASAFSLVMVFFSFAGLYALMGAHLVAALQILVYTGAIMVLFVFVIMLLSQDQPVLDLKESSLLFKCVTVLGLGGLATILIRTILTTKNIQPVGTLTEDKIAEAGGNLKVVAESLFTDHVFHFELTSFLILGAIVATIALAKREPSQGSQS